MLLARKLMSSPALIVDVLTPLEEAARVMGSHDVGCVLVTKNDYPTGIVTERDLTRTLAQRISGATAVQEIMSSPLYSCHPEADILEIAAAMNVNNIKKMPVIENNRVIGVITQTDFLQHLFSVFKQIHYAYSQGQITSEEFADRSAELVKHYEQTSLEGRKNWHMNCADCGHVFFNPEHEDKLRYTECPKCGSERISFQDS